VAARRLASGSRVWERLIKEAVNLSTP
jgi:hypothetical protein